MIVGFRELILSDFGKCLRGTWRLLFQIKSLSNPEGVRKGFYRKVRIRLELFAGQLSQNRFYPFEFRTVVTVRAAANFTAFGSVISFAHEWSR